MVRAITSADSTISERLEPSFIRYNDEGKLESVSVAVQAQIEELIRFVASVMNYSLNDIYKMSIDEFFRDVLRAKKINASKRKNLQQWQTKGSGL